MPNGNIADWLRDHGLERLQALFAEEQIALEDLPELCEHDLGKIGIPLRPRKRLMKAIAALEIPTPRSRRRAANGSESVAGAPAERRQLTVMFCDLVLDTTLG